MSDGFVKGAYQGYRLDTTDEAARAAFVAKFGHEPQEVLRTGSAVLAGPLTVADLEAKKNGGGNVQALFVVEDE